MGSLIYGGREFEFDDRTLVHLQIVFSTKLRRRENFFFSWIQPMERGSGRHAIWIDNGSDIHFAFTGSRVPAVNRDWVDAMLQSASGTVGLQLAPEPPPRG